MSLILAAACLFGGCDVDLGFEEVEDGIGQVGGKADFSTGPLAVVEVGDDFVELLNESDEPVELGGWYLSFSRRRVRLEGDGATVVPPGGLAVVADLGKLPAGIPAHVPLVETSRRLGELLEHSKSLILRTPDKRVSDRMDARSLDGHGVAVERRLRTRTALSALGRTPGSRNALHDTNAIRTHFADPLSQPSNPLPAELASFIDGASVSVDAAIYQLDHPVVIDALVDAIDRGVQVRLVTDSHYLDDPDYAAGYQRIIDAGGFVRGDQKTALQHNKFMVVDDRAVWVGSFNPLLQEGGAFTVSDDALAIASPALARIFTAEMDEMVGGNFGKQKSDSGDHLVHVDGAAIEVYFSPTDRPLDAILTQLSRARSNIYFSEFAFYSQPAATVMQERFAAGVDVRGVLDRRSANSASRYADLLAAGVDVRRPYYDVLLHHKFIIVDYGTTDPVVITGSYNLSNKAETQNDESVVIIHDPHVVRAYFRVWSRMYAAMSGPNTDTTDRSPVVISEVMAGPNQPFVELANTSEASVALEGLILRDRDGSRILLAGALAPSARIVVDAADLAPSYSAPLVLVDGQRRVVSRFDFPGYHGAGVSLERQSLLDSDDQAVWTPSHEPGGSPGF